MSHRRGPIAMEIKYAIADSQNHKCCYCNAGLLSGRLKGQSRNNFRRNTVDHLTPKSRGGTNDVYNLAACCEQCNLDKGNMNVTEYTLLVWMRSGVKL